MFSSGLDRVQHPVAARARGIFLGTLILVAVAAALVSARTVPALFALTVAGFLAVAALRGQLLQAVPPPGPVLGHLAIFLVYAAVSSAWAVEPQTALVAALLAMLVAAGSLVLCTLLAEETRPNLLHMGEGLWIGLVVGLVYLSVEIATDQGVKIWLYNLIGLRPGDVTPVTFLTWSGDKVVAISLSDLNRSMAAVTLFLWPAVAAMLGTLSRPWAAGLVVLTLAMAGAVVMGSAHETSKLALLGSLAAYAAARLSLRATGHVVAAAWVCACLAILPSALIVHRLDLQNAPGMPYTARHRIIIWNHTAQEVLKAPWLGIGAKMTYVLGPRLESEGLARGDEPSLRTLSTHSHSVYLQTWFELGLVGAALLTLVGLSIVQAIRSLAPALQPFAYATFASAAIMAASSYGMWQIWFMGLFGFCAALFALGGRLYLDRSA